MNDNSPLFRQWSLWYLIPDRFTNKNADWKEFLHSIHDFSSIEDFWSVYNSVEKPATLPKGCRYYIFKKGISPLWEDKHNKGGNEISFLINNDTNKEIVSDIFEKVLFSIIGETLPESTSVNGVEFTTRVNNYRITIWTGHVSQESLSTISNALCSILGRKEPNSVSSINK